MRPALCIVVPVLDVRELTRLLPDATRTKPEVRDLAGYGCGTVMHLMRLAAPRLPDEDPTKDLDFNAERIRMRWQAGLDDVRQILAGRAWLAPVGPVDGLVVHDLDRRLQHDDRPAHASR